MKEINKNEGLISIKPRFSKKIIYGEKKYELRRKISKELENVFIYETSPTKSIVAISEIEKIIEKPVQKLWQKTREKNGVSKTEFFQYFEGCSTGFAIKIKKTHRLKRPVELETLKEYDPDFRPPQNYFFVRNGFLDFLKEKTHIPRRWRFNRYFKKKLEELGKKVPFIS